jgi:hypothetical protein
VTVPHPCPHHCPPERGGGLAAVAAVIAVVIAVVAAKPVVHAAETVLEIAAITVGAVLGLAATTAVTWAAVAVCRRERERRAIAAPSVRALPPARPRAIEAARAPVVFLRPADEDAAAPARPRMPGQEQS